MTKIFMNLVNFIDFQYNFQNILKSFKFPRKTPIFIQFPIPNWVRNSPDFQKMGKNSPGWQRCVLVWCTAYNLWTITWIVHFELPSGWKGLTKCIPRDCLNSTLCIIYSLCPHLINIMNIYYYIRYLYNV